MRWLLVLLLTATAHAAPCESAAVRASIRAIWGDTPSKITLTCRPIHAKYAVKLVEVRVAEGGDNVPMHSAIVEADDSIVWSRDSVPGTPGSTYTFAIVDLDGDGLDELVEHELRDGHMGTSSESLTIHRLSEGSVSPGVQVTLAIGGLAKMTGQNNCSATWSVIGGAGPRHPRLQIVGTRTTDPKLAAPPDDCPLEGVHRYRWTGEGLDRLD